MKNIEEKIKQIVSDQLKVDIAEINANSSFVEDLGGDSLDTIELLLRVEEEFNIEIPEEVAEELATVQDVVNCIVKLQSAG